MGMQVETAPSMSISVTLPSAPMKRKLRESKSHAAPPKSKKQRLQQVTAIAKDVMIQLLTKELSYDVSDAEWERLVQLTQAHPNFDKQFTFSTHTQEGWVRPKRKRRSTTLKIVALDCEMCVTVSSSTGARCPNALCRVSAVNGEDMIREVIADLIVHQPAPGFRMLDPKTDIHGITLQMIDQSKISLAKAQKQLLKYINADTIVVGHSVYGDLASLRIDHRRVIDTAMLYQRTGEDPKRATPGLKCLTKHLLHFEMPDGHDSAIDAQASMLAAKYAVRNECGAIIPPMVELHGLKTEVDVRRGGVVPNAAPPQIIPTAFAQAAASTPVLVATPTMETTAAPSKAVEIALPTRQRPVALQTARCSRLRVHRLSRGITHQDIERYFASQAHVVPAVVEPIAWLPAQNKGSTNVTFTTPMHAQLAFDTIRGKLETDAIGREQKVIAITNAKNKVFKHIKVGLMDADP